jgi:hypothetical protein
MEDINKVSQDNGETVTPAETDEAKNNASTDSEVVKTQKTGTGRTANERIQELVREREALKAQLEQAKADKPSSSETGSLEERLLKVELGTKVPEHLKKEIDGMASYAKKHNMPLEDVVTLWDAKNKVSVEDVEKGRQADAEANSTKTGGTANPAVRQPADIAKMKTEDLKAILYEKVAKGERV